MPGLEASAPPSGPAPIPGSPNPSHPPEAPSVARTSTNSDARFIPIRQSTDRASPELAQVAVLALRNMRSRLRMMRDYWVSRYMASKAPLGSCLTSWVTTPVPDSASQIGSFFPRASK
jgi:hypothetical protein